MSIFNANAPMPLVSSGWVKFKPSGPGVIPGMEYFVNQQRGLLAIRGREAGRWHLSVSHQERIPTWDELGSARDNLLPPDVWLMIAHPPRRYWLNIDRRVLHLWEFRDDHLIAMFKEEGEYAQRMGRGTPDSGEER